MKARISQISSSEITSANPGIPLLKLVMPRSAKAPCPPNFVYVNSSWFWPSRKSLILGITISWKSADCSVSGGKILLNAYLR